MYLQNCLGFCKRALNIDGLIFSPLIGKDLILLFLHFFDESIPLHLGNAEGTNGTLAWLFRKTALVCLVQSMKFKEDVGNWAVES